MMLAEEALPKEILDGIDSPDFKGLYFDQAGKPCLVDSKTEHLYGIIAIDARREECT